MRQTASGRWVPDKPGKSSPDRDDTELGRAQEICRAGLAAGVQMPWWYPLMSFEAAVGRLHLKETEQ